MVADEFAFVGAGLLRVGVVHLHREGLPARRRDPILERPPVLAQQESLREPHIHMVPGESAIHGNRAQPLGSGNAGLVLPFVERFTPEVPTKLLVPAVEARALPPGDLHQPRRPDVAPRQDAFEMADPLVVRLQPEAVGAGALPQQRLLAGDLFHRVLGAPLEGGVRLRHMTGNGHRDAHAALGEAVPDAARLPPHVGDAQHIVVLLGRETDHEVQLRPVPAAREHPPAGLVDVLFADILVHDIAHPLRAGFGGEGEAGGLHLRDVVEHFLGEAVRAQAGDAERDAPGNEFRHDFAHQRRHAGVVGGGERSERRFVVAALLHRGHHGADDLLRLPLAHRAVDHPRLAEPAALGAAAGDLDGRTVEDRFGDGHRRVVGEREAVHIVEEGALHRKRRLPPGGRPRDERETGPRAYLAFVERRAVETAAGGEPREQFGAVGDSRLPEPRVFPHQRRQALFGVADQEGVHERREGLGLRRHRPAGEHQRVLRPPLRRVERQSAEVEHGEHIRESEFVLQGKPHQVEVPERPAGLQTHQRQVPFAQLRFHVRPRAEAALERQVGLVVHHLVEDLGAEVAHPDVVHIREAERHPRDETVVGLLHDREPLSPGIPRRSLHFVEEGGVGMLREAHGAVSFPRGNSPVNSERLTLVATTWRTPIPRHSLLRQRVGPRNSSLGNRLSVCE